MSLYLFFFAGFLSWFVLRQLIPCFRSFVLDKPNSRSSHTEPTPRGGGVVFVLFSSLSSVIELVVGSFLPVVALPFVVLPLAVVGFLDDRYDLPSSWRYAVQFVTAVLLISLSPLAQRFFINSGFSFSLLISVLSLLLIAVTAVINFINFMDGVDGLVAGCMLVALFALSIQLSTPWCYWVLMGSLMGFLLWNWHPAKVFMGDVGSTFLGAVFVGLVLQASSWHQSLALLLVSTPLLGDAFLCVLRRFMAGQRVFRAHRLHLFQRLHQAGWSHSRVSRLYIAFTSVLAIALLCGGLSWVLPLALIELLIGFLLDQRVAVPFAAAPSD